MPRRLTRSSPTASKGVRIVKRGREACNGASPLVRKDARVGGIRMQVGGSMVRVCVYVCVYVCVCACGCIYVCVGGCICMCGCVGVYVCMCVGVYVCVCVYICVYVCVLTLTLTLA